MVAQCAAMVLEMVTTSFALAHRGSHSSQSLLGPGQQKAAIDDEPNLWPIGMGRLRFLTGDVEDLPRTG